MIPLLWLCGPPGVGKTAVGWELYSRLMQATAFVDVDQVGMCYPPREDDPERHELKARNVAALRANFGAAGAGGLLVSGVVDARRGPAIAFAGGGDISVCRLRAEGGELVARLGERRGSGAESEAAVREGKLLDQSTFADTSLDTTGLSVDEVADQVCEQIGDWPPRPGGRRPWPAHAPGGGQVLWLCGPTGVGKSTVGFHVYRALLRSGVPAGYVDVDQLGFGPTRQIGVRNLASVWANFRAAGARTLVAVGPIANKSDASVCEQAMSGATFAWYRLHAGPDELRRRILSRRDGGSWPQPGDPLRGASTSHLHKAADQAIADAQVLERQGHGRRIDVSDSTIAESADAIRTFWLRDMSLKRHIP